MSDDSATYPLQQCRAAILGVLANPHDVLRDQVSAATTDAAPDEVGGGANG